GKRVLGITPPALDLLAAYDWPGNVRQLENAVYRAVVLTDGAFLEVPDFPQILAQTNGREDVLRTIETSPVLASPVHIDSAPPRERQPVAVTEPARDRFLTETGDLQTLAAIEREAIAHAIDYHGGRMSRVARALGIGRSTLYRKLHEYGLAEG